MSLRSELKTFAWMAAAFVGLYLIPLGTPRFDGAVTEALALTQWYMREHVILCLLPAFWIAGAIGAFVSQQSVMRYFGPNAPKLASYGVASVSGTILAVCSCTVLPLFSGIYRMGAGLGPATTFLYSGPAINALAIILTAKVLGLQLGVARALGAVVFSVVAGVLMHVLFRREEKTKAIAMAALPEPAAPRPLWQTATFFGLMVAILVMANWTRGDEASGFFAAVFAAKWRLTAALAVALAIILWRWFALSASRPPQPCLPRLIRRRPCSWPSRGSPGPRPVARTRPVSGSASPGTMPSRSSPSSSEVCSSQASSLADPATRVWYPANGSRALWAETPSRPMQSRPWPGR